MKTDVSGQHIVKAQLYEKAEVALKLSEKVMMMSGKPQRQTYHFLITLYANTGNLGEVKRIWESLKLAFPDTNNISYLLVVQALCKLKDVEGLKECFEEWQSNCSSYDEVSKRCYTCLSDSQHV